MLCCCHGYWTHTHIRVLNYIIELEYTEEHKILSVQYECRERGREGVRNHQDTKCVFSRKQKYTGGYLSMLSLPSFRQQYSMFFPLILSHKSKLQCPHYVAIWNAVTTNLTGKLRIRCLRWHTCGVCFCVCKRMRQRQREKECAYERGCGTLSLHRYTIKHTQHISFLTPLLLILLLVLVPGSGLFWTDLVSVRVSAICQIPGDISVTRGLSCEPQSGVSFRIDESVAVILKTPFHLLEVS